MKKLELLFSTLLVPLDFLMIVLAALIAYFIRFESFYRELRPVVYEIPLALYFNIVWPAALVLLVIFAFSGLYTIGPRRRKMDEISKIILACSTGVMIVIVLMFFQRELFSSRFIILVVWILAIFFVSLERLLVRLIQQLFFKKGIGAHRVVVIGAGKTAEVLLRLFHYQPVLGYKVIAHLNDFDPSSRKRLGGLIREPGVDEVFQVTSDFSRQKILELKDFCDEHHIIFKYSTDLLGGPVRHFEVVTLAGIPIVEIKKTPLEGWGRILKRIIDIIGSLVAVIVFTPLMILVSLVIKLDSRGPVIYRNKRVSKEGTFKTYKFRSMHIEYCTGEEYGGDEAEVYETKLISLKSERQGPVYKVLNDPRRTRVGRFLERTSLDELPQFFNVLNGHLSLVGPRPHQPREVAYYQKHHKKVFSLKPGITGLAQISGRSDLDFEEEVKLDTFYIENWSLWLDLYILFKTPFVLFKKRKLT